MDQGDIRRIMTYVGVWTMLFLGAALDFSSEIAVAIAEFAVEVACTFVCALVCALVCAFSGFVMEVGCAATVASAVAITIIVIVTVAVAVTGKPVLQRDVSRFALPHGTKDGNIGQGHQFHRDKDGIHYRWPSINVAKVVVSELGFLLYAN